MSGKEGKVTAGGKERRAARRNAGQVILVVLLAVLVLLFAALWLADVHHLVMARDRTQNAGDAAALAGARWQAETLELEGELNLFHLLALAADDAAAVDAITSAQVRALFAGPLAGVAAAQQAAMRNGAPSNPDFVAFMRDAASRARREYAASAGGTTALPEPWPGAWDEYADMLDAIADGGVAAGVDNAAFYGDPAGGHVMLDPAFYAAVLGRDWCWFHRAAPGLLEDYSDFRWWPALPDPPEAAPFSPELLGLHLLPAPIAPARVARMAGVDEALEEAALRLPAWTGDAPDGLPAQAWIRYDLSRWGGWEVMRDPSFPVVGDLRPEYDYAGADAAMRVENPVDRLTSPESGATPMVWTAAAKPFGYLRAETGGRLPPTATPLVLPAFREVRLIPLDASSAPAGGAFDLAWRRHCAEHLPLYVARGPSVLSGSCRHCAALARWEIPAFRERGVRWLSTNAWKCTISPHGGGPGGGSRHAH